MTSETTLCAFIDRDCDELCAAYGPAGCKRLVGDDVSAIADLARCWLASSEGLGSGVIPISVDGEIGVDYE